MKNGIWIYVMFPLGGILFFLAFVLRGISLLMDKSLQGFETVD